MPTFSRVSSVVVLFALAVLLFASVGQGRPARASFQSAASIGSCPLFPADNIWNQDIASLPVHPNSANFLASIGLIGHLHPDFGAGLYNGEPIGIPYTVVPANQSAVPVSFDYSGESDPGPYPIPANAPIEGGAQSSGDRHVLVVQSDSCKLYEMFSSYPQGNGSWHAGSGAVWSLASNALRPRDWTSADAAGLPILPGLVRYDEVAAGAISHALRFTVQHTQRAFVWPARHQASSLTDPNLPPMGLRLRLKADVSVSGFSPQNQVILRALKQYGMMVADNGSNWFLSGAPDDRWNNDDLSALKAIPGSDFEVVDTSSLQLDPNSGAARPSAANVPPTATAAPASPTTPPVSPSPTLRASTAGSRPAPNSQNSPETNLFGTVLLLVLGGSGVLVLGAFVAWRWLLRGRSP